MQEARALSGIASAAVFVRPHVLMPGQLTSDEQAAIDQEFPGSGVGAHSADSGELGDDYGRYGERVESNWHGGPRRTWMALTLPGRRNSGRGEADERRAARIKLPIPNSWFVGMTPRRNPDIVVAVLWEHGYMGNNSAKLAAQVVDTFVTKQREERREFEDGRGGGAEDRGTEDGGGCGGAERGVIFWLLASSF